MAVNQVHFFLDDVEIKEPQQWDSISVTIKRDDDYHGIGFEASESQLDFYGEAYEYIESIYAVQGLRTSIIFKALREMSHGALDDDNPILSGRLDMGQRKVKCGETCFVTVGVESGGCEQNFRNKIDQTVDLDKTTSQNGQMVLPVYKKLNYDLTLEPRKIDYLTEGSVFGDYDSAGTYKQIVDYREPGGGSKAYVPVRPDFEKVVATNWADTTLTGGTNVGYNGPNGIFEPITPVVLFNEPNPNCFKEAGFVTGRLKGTITMPDTNNLDTWIVFSRGELKNDGEDMFDPADGRAVAFVSLGRLVNPDNYAFDFSYSYSYIPKDNGSDGLTPFLYFKQNPGADFHGYVLWSPDTFFKLEGQKNCPPTTAKVDLIHEALSRMAENISDGCMRVKSEYYGRIASEPFAFSKDGCGGLRALTSGLKIRNAPNATFSASFSDTLKDLKHIDNIGMCIEDDTLPSQMVCRIEELDFFYRDVEIMKCLGIADAQFTTVEGDCASIIKLGYTTWKTQDNFGLDEFNSEREYHTDIATINNTVDITVKMIAGQNAIEVTREQQFASSNDADTAFDDETFIICLKRPDNTGVQDTYIVEQGNIQNPQNIYNPDSVYNYRISPLHNLLRWYRSLVNAYPNITDSTNRLYFSSGTGNYILSGQLPDVYGYGYDNFDEYCKLEGINIAENADVFVTMFNNVSHYLPLWKNETIAFDWTMTLAEYNYLKLNRYGYITYQCGQGATAQGWIKDIKFEPATGKANITLKPRWK